MESSGLLILTGANLALGAIVGFRYRVTVLFPLVALALVESALFGRTDGGWPWISFLPRFTVLIVALNLGYLVGLGMQGVLARSALDGSKVRRFPSP